MAKRPKGIQHRSSASLPRKQAKRFYQTTGWKHLRSDYKKKKRDEHEKIVLSVYQSNPKNTPDDLIAFMESDNPLCEIHLKKGIIKVAQVLDHKMRIRSGGAKLSTSNLQWITKGLHDSKSGKESHE